MKRKTKYLLRDHVLKVTLLLPTVYGFAKTIRRDSMNVGFEALGYLRLASASKVTLSNLGVGNWAYHGIGEVGLHRVGLPVSIFYGNTKKQINHPAATLAKRAKHGRMGRV